MSRPARPLIDRLIEKVKRADGGCLEWIGCRDRDGYGRITVANGTKYGANSLAHRVFYELTCGPVPSDLILRHKCDNPGCVEVMHLEFGTRRDNSRDMVERKRSAYGEKNVNSILTEENVLQIISMPNMPNVDLARLFGVAETTISSVKNGRNWKHIPR